MSLKIDKNFKSKKTQLFSYLRSRATEYLNEIKQQYGEAEYKKGASAIDRALVKEKDSLSTIIRQTAERQGWPAKDTLEAILLLMHCTNVVMLESRNEVWLYE